MKVKEFLITCNLNSIDIDIYDEHDNLIYYGELYMIFHNHEDYNGKTLSDDERQNVLNSSVEAWEITNDDTIEIFTDYRGIE